MLNTFIKGEINDSSIYVKVNTALIESLFNLLIDAGYKVSKATEDEWDVNIEYGVSYILDTIEELDIFEDNNIKAKTITYGN